MATIDDAVALYQGYNYSGTGLWLDESTNTNDVTLNGTIPFDTDHFTFNGNADNWGSAPDHPSIDFAEDFTVIVRASVVDAAGSANMFVIKGSGSPGFGSGNYWAVYESLSGANIDVSQSPPLLVASTGTTVDDEVFVAAIRYDDTANETEAFFNGTGSGTPAIGNTEAASGTTLHIGAWKQSGDFPLNGAIYGVALFDIALTNQEISDIGDILGVVQVASGPSNPEYGDALLKELQVAGATSKEVVGALNELNATSGVEFDLAYRTYRGI